MNPLIPVIQLVDGFATEEHAGGAAQFGIQLARHLDRKRFQPMVVGLWKYGTPSEQRWLDQLAQEGIATTILVERRRKLLPDMFRAAVFLRQVVEQAGIQIINSHFERGDMLGITARLSAPNHPQLVRTQHTDQQWQDRPWLGHLLNAAFPWLFGGEVAISQATSEAMNRRPAALLRMRKATRIYNGLGEEIFNRLVLLRRYDRGFATLAPVLAIVGRLEPQKNHADALRALAIVRQRFPQATLWVIGHGSLRAQLEQQAADLGLSAAVRFLGQRGDIPQLLAQADVLVSSSIWEGFPTVVLEAMAAGVPVVATDVSGSRELVRTGETGMLVPQRDPAALAAAICTLLADPIHAVGMAETAAEEVEQFRFSRIARRYGQLYRELV